MTRRSGMETGKCHTLHGFRNGLEATLLMQADGADLMQGSPDRSADRESIQDAVVLSFRDKSTRLPLVYCVHQGESHPQGKHSCKTATFNKALPPFIASL